MTTTAHSQSKWGKGAGPLLKGAFFTPYACVFLKSNASLSRDKAEIEIDALKKQNEDLRKQIERANKKVEKLKEELQDIQMAYKVQLSLVSSCVQLPSLSSIGDTCRRPGPLP